MTLENRGSLKVRTIMDYDIIVILALSSIDCTQEQAMEKQDVREEIIYPTRGRRVPLSA